MDMPRELSQQECLQLLSHEEVARVAVCTPTGPHIVPVNYVVVDDAIVFRTAPYSVLGTVAGRRRSPLRSTTSTTSSDAGGAWSPRAMARRSRTRTRCRPSPALPTSSHGPEAAVISTSGCRGSLSPAARSVARLPPAPRHSEEQPGRRSRTGSRPCGLGCHVCRARGAAWGRSGRAGLSVGVRSHGRVRRARR